MANRWGDNGNSLRFLFYWALKPLWTVTVAMILTDACFLEEKLFANKGPYSQSYGFSSSHVWI